jgi:transforming growth factor-beta-induced protein
VKKLLLDHVVLGSRIDLTNVTGDTSFKTLGGRTVHVRRTKDDKLKANDANIVERKVEVPNGLLVVLDNYLFPEEQVTKENATQGKLVDIAAFAPSEDAKNQSNTTFVENVMEVLGFLKSGVRVFQHFLSRSNVSKLLDDGSFGGLKFGCLLSVACRGGVHCVCADGSRLPEVAPHRLGFLPLQCPGIYREHHH